jgi:ribosomal protein S12 methylthiotransferase accessory factor
MSTAPTLGGALLRRAVNFRLGIVPAVHILPTTMSDIAGVWHASATRPGPGPQSAPAGGVGWTRDAAERAAIGEALERYAAAVADLSEPEGTHPSAGALGLEDFSLFTPVQRRAPGFPYADVFAGPVRWTTAWSLDDGAEAWHVPALLVGLGGPDGHAVGHGLSTSSGLAAATSTPLALLRAVQEVVERDALMTTWNHSLPGRHVRLPAPYATLVADRPGSAVAVDTTPAWSPHPVAVVCGELPIRGRRRIAMGVACRATWEDALDKAFLEWCQGILFAGVFVGERPGLRYDRPSAVRTFEDHAAHYTVHPDRWDRVPLTTQAPGAGRPPAGSPACDAAAELLTLTGTLADAGVRLLWRNLTTVDLRQIGISVVRVLSPDLTPIHFDTDWPFLGGRAADVAWRYPDLAASAGEFPNPLPHPLG